MYTLMKTFCIAVVMVAFGFCTTALADTQDFTSPAGLLGTSQNYTLAGQTITATGFCSGTCTQGSALFGKTGGGDENGLGLASDPSGVNEIFKGTDFIQIDLSKLIAAGITTVTFSMGSTTNGDMWSVNACPTSMTLCTGGAGFSFSGTDQLTLHTITGLSTSTEFLDFTSTNGNVLIHSLSATAVPELNTLLMVGSGILGLAGIVRRKLNR